LVSQVLDLFPDLGSGFVVKLLDEYGDEVEQVISHLLEGSLPAYLESADRSEEL
jgi:activating signal cointegrator complex subunit 2